MKPISASLLLFPLFLNPSFAAGDSAPMDAGQIAAPSEDELKQLRAAPSVALLKVTGPATADCTGIGHKHLKLDVISARPGRAIRTAHHSFALHLKGPQKDSYFVAGLALDKWVPQKWLCLPGSLAADSSVQLMVRVANEAEGRALLDKLRRDSAN